MNKIKNFFLKYINMAGTGVAGFAVVVAIIAFVAFLVVFGPWVFIWAINTLAHEGGATNFDIPFNFWTWLAAFLIGGLKLSFNKK